MRKIERFAYVKHSSQEMFLLVNDIESYPEFLPWCESTEIHESSNEIITASIRMERAGLKASFTSTNHMKLYESIDLSLKDGPFNHFQGGWKFDDLGKDGSKIYFELEFEFKNKLLDMTLGPFFEDICEMMVNAFVKRADEKNDHSRL